jgi:hypothetical protein
MQMIRRVVPKASLFASFLLTCLLIVTAMQPSLAATPASAATKDLSIDAYFGDWQGKATATSETDEDFPTSARDIAVTVAASDLGGLLVSWSTLQRQKGNPSAPLEVMKSTTVEFVPAPTPNTWRAKTDVDPYSGGILYWARLDGSGLVISSFAINADGKPELQTYRRRLTGSDMRLEFTNVNDGKLVRSVKGTLRRLRTR